MTLLFCVQVQATLTCLLLYVSQDMRSTQEVNKSTRSTIIEPSITPHWKEALKVLVRTEFIIEA